MDYRTKTSKYPIMELRKLTLKYDKLKSSYEKDISARNEAEEKLKSSEDKFRKAFETNPDAITINRMSDGRFVSINDGFSKVTGYSKEDIKDKTSTELNIWTSPFQRESIITGLSSSGMVQNMEGTFRKKDGTIRNGMMSATIISLDDVPHILSITRDITASKHAEDEIKKLNSMLEERVIERTSQLEAANSELQAFAYSVSHDLRAPLRAIEGFSKFILEEHGAKLDPEGQRLFGLIRSNSQKMDKLITDMLSLTRVTRSEQRKSKVDMTKMALSMFNEVASAEIREHIKLHIDELPETCCDGTYIKLVWINLISNAIKFSSIKKEPEIKIGGYSESGRNVYYVSDNGVGFNPEYAHKLFGVFQRLHKPGEFEGNGVGLAIVQRIIHRHGGTVWAEGKEGNGATFYFSLPVKKGNKDLSAKNVEQ